MERHLEASTTLRAPLERVREVLRDRPHAMVSEHATLDERAARRFRTDVRVTLGAGASIHQEVEIEMGPVRAEDDLLRVPLRWSATGRTSLFPVFDGMATVLVSDGHTVLAIEGSYTAPLGLLGSIGDRLLGRRAADATADAFVQHVAHRLDDEVDRVPGTRPRTVATYAVDLRELERSDYFHG